MCFIHLLYVGHDITLYRSKIDFTPVMRFQVLTQASMKEFFEMLRRVL
jgi:hypothetical protein